MHQLHAALHFLVGLHYLDYLRSAADVLLVAYIVYQLMMLAKPTRAWQILIGLGLLLLLSLLSQELKLQTLNWLLGGLVYLGPVAVVILLYPELRHVLEGLGRFGFFGNSFFGLTKRDVMDFVGEIVRAATVLSSRRTGALIVIERETGLADIIETGTPLNAEVTAELLGTIFHPGSPLHDGAVVIRRGRIAAAGCTLPLTESHNVGAHIHTRHKAAIGITEQSDCVVVVVSEETGIISMAMEGNLTRHLRDSALEDKLTQVLQGGDARASLRRRLNTPLGKQSVRDNPGPPGPSASAAAKEPSGAVTGASGLKP